MRCPTCGGENTSGTTECDSCGQPLGPTQGPPADVAVKLSGAAVASALIALLSWLCFVPGMVAAMDPYVLHPRSAFVEFTALGNLFGTGLAFVLGVAGLGQIERSGGRRTGYGFAAIGASAPAVLILAAMYVPFHAGKMNAPRMRCGVNLAGIGKAMLIYANDYDDKLPLAGGQGTVWCPGLADWRSERRADAFELDPNGAGGQATISSSLYLLVRCGDVPVEKFVCQGERGVRPFDPARYRIGGKKLTDVWDFGPDPAQHCSYAYHQPYGPFAVTTYAEGGMAVAADHNPWIDSARWKAGDFSTFQPELTPYRGTAEQARKGSAKAHMRDGQNVLFLDSHVEFAKRAVCGLEGDNIYTAWDGDDKVRGVPPKPYESQPAGARDSLLVNDPPLKR